MISPIPAREKHLLRVRIPLNLPSFGADQVQASVIREELETAIDNQALMEAFCLEHPPYALSGNHFVLACKKLSELPLEDQPDDITWFSAEFFIVPVPFEEILSKHQFSLRK
jgi:hypothetical protein